jgi:hypothetical protein
MLRVGIHVVIRLCDSGQLKCWKVPGTKGTRRIPLAEARRFMRENNIPEVPK